MLAHCNEYIREWLPERISPRELTQLGQIGRPVTIEVEHDGATHKWQIRAGKDGKLYFGDNEASHCRYRMPLSVFHDLIRAKTSPQRAFFSGRLKIDGDMILALRVGNLLGEVFKRVPYVEVPPQATTKAVTTSPQLTEHQRAMLALHLDPIDGAPYWIGQAQKLQVSASDLQTIDDLRIFGMMNRERMAGHSFRDMLPRRILRQQLPLVLGETGGTMGEPITLAWTREDFARAFVEPLVTRLSRLGVTDLRQWHFVGPTGPHIIGKAADAIAQRTTGCDALKVDFDPRWHRRLVAGSFASERHLNHIIEQALVHLRREQVDCLFITPTILRQMMDHHNGSWLQRLRLVHLGGQSITPDERNSFRQRLPHECLLINGYGNSMIGCLLDDDEHPLEYSSADHRFVLSVVDSAETMARCSPGERGRVMLHRFDASAMILNQVERDEATATNNSMLFPRPIASGSGFATQGGIY